MVITISREFGAGGSAVAARVAAALGWTVVDNEFVARVAEKAGCAPDAVEAAQERAPGFLERLGRVLTLATPQLGEPDLGEPADLQEERIAKLTESVVRELAERGRVVLVGRAAPAVLAWTEGTLHVRLVAPVPFRVRVVRERLGVDDEEARRRLTETDASRARYHRRFYEREWADPVHYDLVLNTARFGFDGAADVITATARTRGW
jgi:cytidylate kinase